MSHDPVLTDPGLYRVIFENERVRVLEYKDRPGDKTAPHVHPDSVMITLTSFRRRLTTEGRQVDLALDAGQARWLGAQEHAGENIGDTPTHSVFVELKEQAPRTDPAVASPPPLGPDM
ncbi:cupin domain-containing protein [Microbispora siamensis]